MSKEQKELEKSKEEIEEEEEEKSITEEDIDKTLDTMADLLKARKFEPEEEEEDEEEEEEEEEKSYTSNFEANETLAKAIEVSDFLASLVDETETSIAAIGKDISRFQKSQSQFDSKFIEGLEKLAKTIAGLDERLKVVEKTPVSAGPKSVMKSAQVMEKSFAGKGEGENPVDSLPRSRVSALLAKAVEQGKIPDSVLFSFEGNRSFQLREEEKDILKSLM